MSSDFVSKALDRYRNEINVRVKSFDDYMASHKEILRCYVCDSPLTDDEVNSQKRLRLKICQRCKKRKANEKKAWEGVMND